MDKYTENLISENMFAQVDDKGNQYFLMNEIPDHRKDKTAIPISDGITRGNNGNESPNINTCGLYLLVEWKYSSTSWMKLKYLK